MNPVADAETTRRIGVPGAPSARLPLPRAANLTFVSFWVVAVATLVEIVSFYYEQSGGTGSTRVIALAVLVLVVTARTSPVRAVGTHGILMLLAVILYMVIGTTVAMYHDPQFLFDWGFQYELLGLLMVTAAATGVHDIASRIGTKRMLAGILAILTVSCLGVMMLSIVMQLLRWYALTLYDPVRSSGGHQEPNQAAFVATLGFATACAMAIWQKRQGWATAAMIISTVTIVLTMSRTGLVIWTVLVVASNVYAYRIRGSILAVPAGLSVAAGLVLVGWYLVSPDAVTFRRLVEFDSARLLMWAHGVSVILESPLVGHGIRSFLYLRDYTTTSCAGAGGTCGVHNQYLLLIGEAGILPLLLWVLFIAVAFKKCSWPPDSLHKAVAGGWMICLVLYSMTIHTLFPIPANFFIIGVACGLLTWEEATSDGDLHRDKPLE